MNRHFSRIVILLRLSSHTAALAMLSFCNLPLHAYFNQLNLIASGCDVADECPTEASFICEKDPRRRPGASVNVH